jgi:hypothetical protein
VLGFDFRDEINVLRTRYVLFAVAIEEEEEEEEEEAIDFFYAAFSRTEKSTVSRR